MSIRFASGSGHLWRAQPLGDDFTVQDWSLLPAYERARAEAIGHRAARTRFVVGRALLRRSITELLPHLDARSHLVSVAPSGRPRIAQYPDLDISLSHTAGLTVAAVSSVGPTGIDVEPLGRSDLPRLDRWLTRAERRDLDALAPEPRNYRLLESWVAKEAVLKSCDHLGAVTRRSIEVRRSQDGPVEAITTAIEPPATAALFSYQLQGAYLMAIAIHLRLHPPP
jgi:phosphopantetheinyl transferase